MKKFLILGNFLLFTLILCAQNDYFLFIQSESNQPYYVQIQGKTLSSSAIGHLVISGLKDSSYVLNIGFPKNQFPEQLFHLEINKRDAGYQLKNLGPEGWSLLNIQTSQLIKAHQAEAKKQTIAYGDIKRSDVFSTLMAGLVNDSAVLYTSIAKAEPPKESSRTSIPDTPVANNDIVKPESTGKKDSSLTKAEVIKQDEIAKTDSLVTKEVAKEGISRKDTAMTTVAAKQSDISKKDTSSVKPAIVKQEEAIRKDSAIVPRDIARQDGVLKMDTGVNTVPVKQLPVVNEQKRPDTLSIAQSNADSSPAKVKPTNVKPLIIWFSETKTSKGTELVYFDMSSQDKIDTIRILITPEETPTRDAIKKENKVDSIEEKKEDQKSNSGKFLGKIFGKKNNKETTDVGKRQPETNASTIKVTTVEVKKAGDSALIRNKNGSDTDAEKLEANNNPTEKKEQKTGSEKFFGKLFGKKNRSEPSGADTISKTASAKNASTIKVTTIEDTKQVDPAVAPAKKNQADESTAEVEKLKKDQENAEKTSTERLFGKVFSKKKKAKSSEGDADNKSEPTKASSSIKVTSVDNSSASDNKVRPGKVVTNSDCREFASDYDVDKLRVRMLGEKDTDAQLMEARKIFKMKCFSAKQIESLSTLFRTDEGKYRLFDTAYPFVSDTNNFKALVSLLSEEYYINRFKAMVRM